MAIPSPTPILIKKTAQRLKQSALKRMLLITFSKVFINKQDFLLVRRGIALSQWKMFNI